MENNRRETSFGGSAGETPCHILTAVKGSRWIVQSCSVLLYKTDQSPLPTTPDQYSFAYTCAGRPFQQLFHFLQSMKFVLIPAIFLAAFAHAACQDNADGFASLNGGTTGGNGGTIVTVTTQTDLEKYATSDGKYLIKIPGRITVTPKGKEIDVANDKTIIGVGAFGEIYNGGFKIINKKNVIIRNLRIGKCASALASC